MNLEFVLEKVRNEPNFETFQYKGYKCLIKRNPDLGNLNGYVGFPYGHRFYKKGNICDDFDDIEVHGGITFANFWEDQKDGLWYLGFDTAHYMDLCPFMAMRDREFGIIYSQMDTTYKDIEFVRNEIKQLVDQIEEKQKA